MKEMFEYREGHVTDLDCRVEIMERFTKEQLSDPSKFAISWSCVDGAEPSLSELPKFFDFLASKNVFVIVNEWHRYVEQQIGHEINVIREGCVKRHLAISRELLTAVYTAQVLVSVIYKCF